MRSSRKYDTAREYYKQAIHFYELAGNSAMMQVVRGCIERYLDQRLPLDVPRVVA